MHPCPGHKKPRQARNLCCLDHRKDGPPCPHPRLRRVHHPHRRLYLGHRCRDQLGGRQEEERCLQRVRHELEPWTSKIRPQHPLSNGFRDRGCVRGKEIRDCNLGFLRQRGAHKSDLEPRVRRRRGVRGCGFRRNLGRGQHHCLGDLHRLPRAAAGGSSAVLVQLVAKADAAGAGLPGHGGRRGEAVRDELCRAVCQRGGGVAERGLAGGGGGPGRVVCGLGGCWVP